MSNATYIKTLVEHAAQTMPDSLVQRKRVLRAIEHVMVDHPVLRDVRSQLASLEAVERLSEQLRLRFTRQTETESLNK